MIKGKVSYMAPEQIRLEALDRRTDVFAAGILLYVLTTGRHPFKADEQSKTAIAITSGAPAIKPSKLVPGYPERLERVVLKALAKAPEDRYATAQELGDDLLRTMPPSRVAPHEELQKYMSELLPERLAEHQALIRKALGVWDPLGPQSSALPKTAHSSSTLRAVSVSDATRNAPLVESSASPDAPADIPTGAPEARRPRSRSATTLLAITAGATIGAVAIVATLGSRPGADPSQGSHATAALSTPSASHPSTSPPLPPVEALPPVAPQAVEPAPSAQPNALEPSPATKKSARPTASRSAKAKPAPNAATGLKNPYAQ
jgi:serine/threonine-protein kinase